MELSRKAKSRDLKSGPHRSLIITVATIKELIMSAPSKANINKLDNPARVTANYRHETELLYRA